MTVVLSVIYRRSEALIRQPTFRNAEQTALNVCHLYLLNSGFMRAGILKGNAVRPISGDQETQVFQVTDSTEKTMTIRMLMIAQNELITFDFRYYFCEIMIKFI